MDSKTSTRAVFIFRLEHQLRCKPQSNYWRLKLSTWNPAKYPLHLWTSQVEVTLPEGYEDRIISFDTKGVDVLQFKKRGRTLGTVQLDMKINNFPGSIQYKLEPDCLNNAVHHFVHMIISQEERHKYEEIGATVFTFNESEFIKVKKYIKQCLADHADHISTLDAKSLTAYPQSSSSKAATTATSTSSSTSTITTTNVKASDPSETKLTLTSSKSLPKLVLKSGRGGYNCHIKHSENDAQGNHHPPTGKGGSDRHSSQKRVRSNSSKEEKKVSHSHSEKSQKKKRSRPSKEMKETPADLAVLKDKFHSTFPEEKSTFVVANAAATASAAPAVIHKKATSSPFIPETTSPMRSSGVSPNLSAPTQVGDSPPPPPVASSLTTSSNYKASVVGKVELKPREASPSPSCEKADWVLPFQNYGSPSYNNNNNNNISPNFVAGARESLPHLPSAALSPLREEDVDRCWHNSQQQYVDRYTPRSSIISIPPKHLPDVIKMRATEQDVRKEEEVITRSGRAVIVSLDLRQAVAERMLNACISEEFQEAILSLFHYYGAYEETKNNGSIVSIRYLPASGVIDLLQLFEDRGI